MVAVVVVVVVVDGGMTRLEVRGWVRLLLATSHTTSCARLLAARARLETRPAPARRVDTERSSSSILAEARYQARLAGG